MKNTKRQVKVDWAGLSISTDGSFLVGVRQNNHSQCLHFASSQKLKEAIDNRKLVAKNWIIAVPRNLCILKPLSLPTDNLAEASKMAEFELSQLVPLPPEEVVYSCLPLGQDDGMLEVMVCILQIERLEKFLEPITQIGIEPRRIVLSSMALSNTSDPLAQSDNDSINITVVMDHSRGEVITHKNNVLSICNSISPIKDDPNRLYDRIVQEICLQLEQLPPQDRKKININLAGPQKSITTIKEQLNSAIGSNRIKITQNNHIVSFNETKEGELLEERFIFDAALARGLVDLAINSRWPTFNLVQRNVLEKLDRKLLRVKATLGGILAVFFVILLWLCMWSMNRQEQLLYRQIQDQIAPIEKTAGQVEYMQEQIKAVMGQLANRRGIIGIMKDLFEHTPKHITLSSLSYMAGDNGTAQFKGQADTLANAFGYTEDMSAAKYLNAIQIENAQQVSRPGGSIVEFKGHCLIKKD